MSVDETLALESVGYSPVGLTTGSSTYRIPEVGRYAYFKENREVGVFTAGLEAARRSALRRVWSAAVDLRADGVVGLNFDPPRIPKDGDEVSVSVSGTAIAANGDALLRPTRRSGENPFTSNLNGHEFALLARAGYLPKGFVVGVCVFHVGRRTVAQTMHNLLQNTELTLLTEALYASREQAMARMQSEALHVEADGVVGVTVEETTHAWGSRVIEFLAFGTAVELQTATHRRLHPSIVVSLGDG